MTPIEVIQFQVLAAGFALDTAAPYILAALAGVFISLTPMFCWLKLRTIDKRAHVIHSDLVNLAEQILDSQKEILATHQKVYEQLYEQTANANFKLRDEKSSSSTGPFHESREE
jgi:hypothetical protein